MWRAPHKRKCSLCEKTINFDAPLVTTWRCRKCGEVQQGLICDSCRHSKICEDCYIESEQSRSLLKENADGVPGDNNDKFYKSRKFWVFVAISLLIMVVLYYYLKKDDTIDESNFIQKLKSVYPSQRAETWCHLLSVLENKDSSVKSITFLHNEDKTTSNCLINDVVSRFSGVNIEEITFSDVGFEGVDYGLVLEHYRAVVKKFRVFRADLTKMPGKLARIFHSLCDEVSSDVKPSLFIFTIKCSNSTKNLKPMARATSVLQESWNDLPDSELYPLLSRIIKNVVEIVPEGRSSCIK